MMRIVLLASIAAAGPVGAAEIEPAALIALLERRCLTPMMAGQPADTAGLDVAEGAPSIGTPDSRHDFTDVIPGVDLELRTISAGVSSCSVSHPIESPAQAEAINDQLAVLARERRFNTLNAPCDTEGIHSYRLFESAGLTPEGRFIGIASFVIDVPPLPAFQSLTVAESDVPLTRHGACNE